MKSAACLFALILSGMCLSPVMAGDVKVVPTPKHLIDRGEVLRIPEPSKAVIIIGSEASEPEAFAGERLQTLVERRFKLTIPIIREDAVPTGATTRILLGIPDNNTMLSEFCDRNGIAISLTGELPENDAYILEVLDDANTIVVLGSNERSVIYGVQTLFKLLRCEKDGLRVPVVSIRDWPSITWRGGTRLLGATTEDLDEWLWSGFNYLRCGRRNDEDWETVRTAIAEAHKRGFFVYGVRSTAVAPPEFDQVMDDYRRFIECGADGLWMSFDDPGPGVNTWPLMERVIALGREHGITGRAIAITPPAGDYNHIDTPFNRERVQIQGMENALWYFTRVPCVGDLHTARDVGIKTPPAWWHNWPRVEGGISHRWYAAGNLRSDGNMLYIEVPPMTWGWGHPNYEQITSCAEYTDTILPCTGGNPMYRAAPIGFFAWDPMQHDFVATREAIYDAALGPDCVPLMLQYEDIHHLLQSYFTHPSGGLGFADRFPARLKPAADRKDFERLAGSLESLANEISRRAPETSILPPEVLESVFLEPMRAEPQIARVLASPDFPENWWPAYEGELLQLIAEGKNPAARKLAIEKGAVLARRLAVIDEKLSPLLNTSQYLPFWQERADAHSAGDLKKAVEMFHDRMTAVANLDGMTEKCIKAQTETAGEVEAEVTPEQMAPTIRRKGDWAAALYSKEGFTAVHMGFPAQKDSESGDYCQVSFRADIPSGGEHQLRFLLDIDTFASPNAGYDRRSGIRSVQLLHGDDVLWEEDALIAAKRESPWRTVDLGNLTGRQEFTIRVVDRVAFRGYPTLNWVGDSGESKGWTSVDADSYSMSLLLGLVLVVDASDE